MKILIPFILYLIAMVVVIADALFSAVFNDGVTSYNSNANMIKNVEKIINRSDILASQNIQIESTLSITVSASCVNVDLDYRKLLACSSDTIIHEFFRLRILKAAQSVIEKVIGVAFPLSPKNIICNAAHVMPVDFNSNIQDLENGSYLTAASALL
jgi:hypothetical protein